MRRINVYIDEAMFEFLNSLSGTLSENVRTAIFEHYKKLRETASESQSKKVGDSHE